MARAAAKMTKAQLEELVATLQAAADTKAKEAEAAIGKVNDMEGKIRQLEEAAAAAAATITAATEAAAAAEAAAATAAAPPTPGATTEAPNVHGARLKGIPKPKGKFNLQTAIGVDKTRYRAMLHDIRCGVFSAGLDWHVDFRHQDPVRLGCLIKNVSDVSFLQIRDLMEYLTSQMRDDYPELTKFQANWAIAEMAKAYMQNK
ncbi:hypothetical protein EIP86_001112, partial [Pleurotus ostreatoroseus]